MINNFFINKYNKILKPYYIMNYVMKIIIYLNQKLKNK